VKFKICQFGNCLLAFYSRNFAKVGQSKAQVERKDRSMIDWRKVKELHNEIGHDDFGEVVDLFLTEVEEMIDALKNSSSNTNPEEAAHFLKGCALNLGFRKFSDLCQTAEVSAGKGESIDLEEIFACYDVTKSEFLAGLKIHLGG